MTSPMGGIAELNEDLLNNEQNKNSSKRLRIYSDKSNV